MSLAVLLSRSLVGMDAPVVRVETHLAPGLPAFTMVGLADAEVRESRERVRAAIHSSGFAFPAGRLTVNLSPADLPKESGRFDLPIALGVLLASGQIDLSSSHATPGPVDALSARVRAENQHPLESWVLAGELSLTGVLVPVAGAIAIALAVARSQPCATLVLPAENAAQAARVPGLRVLVAHSLAGVVSHLRGQSALVPAVALPAAASPLARSCLSDVRGQGVARRALEIAAAGGHSLLMTGAPGVGKSMLAQRLPGILPHLTETEALEVAAIAAFACERETPWRVRPFRSPHHSATLAAVIGGGARPRPGEVTLAHRGVLFLDEIPEFDRRVLEGLREPLENRCVSIARALMRVEFPADFQLIAAMNPCPCGWLGHPQRHCHCSREVVHAYQGRLSGPLLDRIDLVVTIADTESNMLELPPGETSAEVRERVVQARTRQTARQNALNSAMPAGMIDAHCALDSGGRALMAQLLQRYRLSARSIHRSLRVARTCADLADSVAVGAVHLAEAFQYRIRSRSS
ncbi:MAG: YifB family Mg chelatase-like AAA ATPase [Burkholderiaceae bacterium]|nr:YifB family Mg chelatase-like AAA ATPase [Burkholderiaceae bacterium]